MYADDTGGAQFCLAGELDMSCETEFDTALTRLLRLCADGELVIDGHDLDFVDHRGLARLTTTSRSEASEQCCAPTRPP